MASLRARSSRYRADASDNDRRRLGRSGATVPPVDRDLSLLFWDGHPWMARDAPILADLSLAAI
jgi:hypothetical protein